MKMKRPWKDPIYSNDSFDIYEDAFPVNKGHLLFVPIIDENESVIKCLEAAYRYGLEKVKSGDCDAFNVGFNGGEAAGQTCSWRHVHMIPRFNGDVESPVGGVRGVIPSRQNYKIGEYYSENRKKIYGED